MTAERARRHLVIFARQPRYGVGKRRLAQDVGNLAALRFSRSALAELVRRLGRDPHWTLWLAITPDRPTAWVRQGHPIGQGKGDLGERLTRVARALPPGPVVILGADTPGVTRTDVTRAFHHLGSHAAVLGPARDGGYWLIGLRRAPRDPVPFTGIRWSTEHTLADTLTSLAGHPVAELQMREDVDDGPALRRALRRRRLV
jgi:rSAM/selenodomain-associated transferase 1